MLIIGKPFQKQVFNPIFKESCTGLMLDKHELKEGMFVKMGDMLNGLLYSQPFPIWDFSHLGEYEFNWDSQIALFSSGDRFSPSHAYRVFLFDHLFSGRQTELFQMKGKHSLSTHREMIVMKNLRMFPEQQGAALPSIIFNTETRDCFQFCHQGDLIDIQKLADNRGYQLIIEKDSQYEYLLLKDGRLFSWHQADRREQGVLSEKAALGKPREVKNYHEYWGTGLLNHLLPSNKIVAELEAFTYGAIDGMECWNIKLTFTTHAEEKQEKHYGICIPNGQIMELPFILQPVLEGNPIENHLGKALNDHFHEYIR